MIELKEKNYITGLKIAQLFSNLNRKEQAILTAESLLILKIPMEKTLKMMQIIDPNLKIENNTFNIDNKVYKFHKLTW